MNTSSLRSCWSWLVTKFWWLWAANALIAVFVVFIFILGWNHGTITAPNIPAWCGILLGVLAIVGGSLYFRSKGYVDAALLAVAIMPVSLVFRLVGSILFGLFYLLVSLVAHLFGHGPDELAIPRDSLGILPGDSTNRVCASEQTTHMSATVHPR